MQNILRRKDLFAFALLMQSLSQQAMAQGLSNANTLMQNILTVMQGISVAVVSIAVMWVGYKMVFQHARWSEVANIVIGALFIGGAGAIASWLLG